VGGEPAGVFERKIAMIKSLWRRIWTTLKAEFEKRAKKIKAPQTPDEIIPEFTNDYQRIYGEDLISICLYGSGARGAYIPRRSDLNFLIVLTEEGIKELSKAFKVVARWRRRRVTTPLFMTNEYIATSLDAFPLEFLNIKQHYRVVWGKDPLAGIKINRQRLRLQVEREVKGKLLQLRGAYLASRGWGINLVALASQSVIALLSIFQGILYLRDKEIPHQRGGVIKAVATETGLAAEPFMRLLDVKEGKIKLPARVMKSLMKSYIEEVSRLAAWVDKM
jgi:predicted nucleotidyltransferase